MHVFAYDTETEPFRPGLMQPPIVCLQWCEVFDHGVGPAHVVTPAEGLAWLWDRLHEPDTRLVGAEVSYDVLSPVHTAAEHGHALLAAFVKAYDEDRITDVLIRQKLIDLARGCYRFERNDHGVTVGVNGYGLDDLAWRYCKIRLNKDNPWRKSYHLLREVPIDQWPRDAYEYARDDATATGMVYLAQARPSARVQLNFPGRNTADALADEYRQARGALWLKAMSCYGLKTDPRAVEIFEHYIREDYADTVEELIQAKLVRREYHVSRAACLAYIAKRPALLALCAKKNTPSIVLGGAQRQALAAADPTLSILVDPESARPEAFVAGLVTCSEHRNTKDAARAMCAWHERNGTKPALTKTGAERAKRGEPILDGEYVALDKDACLSTGDPVLLAYAELVSLAKAISTDIPILKAGEHLPIHTHFEPLLGTGRTSSAAPNVQNQARGRKDRIGSRECFVPRPGHVLIDSDYGKLELHTLAQTCIWTLGYSKLAQVLNAGEDPHTQVAAKIQGVSLEAAKALEKAHDHDFANARNAAKPVNFGKPGGLGPDTLRAFAAKGYGVVRPREFWVGIIDTWKATWSEMPDYFRMIDSLEAFDGSGRFNVIQPWSMRLRAGATYCSACNTFFQGLGADVAKLAGWYLFKACYVDRSSVLFGCRPVLFVHDQFLIECPEDGSQVARASEVQRLMDLAGAQVLPDVPVKCKPILVRRYSKNATVTYDADGVLTAWEDVRLIQVSA